LPIYRQPAPTPVEPPPEPAETSPPPRPALVGDVVLFFERITARRDPFYPPRPGHDTGYVWRSWPALVVSHADQNKLAGRLNLTTFTSEPNRVVEFRPFVPHSGEPQPKGEAPREAYWAWPGNP
jgi:hypothetical protein